MDVLGCPTMHEKTASKSPTLDRPVFVVSLTTLVVLSGILLMEPEASLARMEVMLRFLTHDLG